MDRGHVVAGRFEIERRAGAGAMGAVYRARDRESGAAVALKVLSGDAPAERFAREARVLAELRHPAIVRYLAHGETDEGAPYLAMEWLEGESLADRLKATRFGVGETIALGLRIAEGLAEAHRRGVVHRDVKPANIVVPEGRLGAVRLIDFGVARLVTRPVRTGSPAAPSARLTGTGAMIGTPGYMAPEQARGEPEVGPPADVFALGCVLYRCLTGSAPFEGEDLLAVLVKIVLESPPAPSELAPEVPEALDDLIQRMLSKSASARPKDAGEVAKELGALSLHPTEPAPPSRRRQAITATEQHVACVLLVAPHHSELSLAALSADAARFGARLEPLADGSLLVVVDSADVARDRPVQAARCALALRAALPGISMAIATGRAVVGRPWVGEAIDRAASLLGSKSGDAGPRDDPEMPIRLDPATAGLLDGRFDIRGDDRGLSLHGQRVHTEAARVLLGKPTPCVGRDAELRMLEDLFTECVAESAPRAVLLTGPPGIGKSRLRHELVRWLRSREPSAEPDRAAPTAVWIARGEPMRAGSPFGILAPVIRREAGILDGEPLVVSRHKLRARVGRHVGPGDVARVSEFLGELASVPFPDDGSVQLRAARSEARLMGDQMQRAWTDFVAAECAAGPVALILEDLHWGDRPSIAFVSAALRQLRGAPLFVLALARLEGQDLSRELWREHQALRLSPLGPKPSEKLIRAMLGDALTAETIGRLVERAAGNALYLEELIRATAEGKSENLPETVLAMVQARVEDLDPDARRILRAGSILGRVFWRGAVETLLGGAPARTLVAGRLGRLVDREVVFTRRPARFPGEDEYVFRHALVREAAYGMLPEADRALGHRLAGEWLERAGETDALTLAEHAERGGNLERAVRWYRRAAEQALEGNDFAGVLDRAERGERCGASGETLGDLRFLQTEAHNWRGEHAEGLSRAEDAMRLLPRGSDRWFEAATALSMSSSFLGDVERAAWVGRELRATEPRSSERVVIARARAANSLYFTAEHELAGELLLLAQAAVGDFDANPRVRAYVAWAQSSRAAVRGDVGAYAELTRAIVASFEEIADARAVCGALGNLGNALIQLGMYPEAARYLGEAATAGDRIGLATTAAGAKHNLGLALLRMGDVDRAGAAEGEALSLFAEHKHVRMQGACGIYMAEIFAQRADLERAETHARIAADLLHDSPPLRSYALGVLARVLHDQHRHDEALAAAREALELLESLGAVEEGESTIRLAYAEALHAAGDQEGARLAIEAARARLLERAAKIQDPAWRASFLERVPENARTIELAGRWRGAADARTPDL